MPFRYPHRRAGARSARLALLLSALVLAFCLPAASPPVSAQAADDNTSNAFASVPAITLPDAERLIGGVPKISVKFVDKPLGDILAEYIRQSGLNLQFDMRYRPVDPRQEISFAIQDMPLWEAVQKLEARTNGQIVLQEKSLILHGITALENASPQSMRAPLYLLDPAYLTRNVEAVRNYSTDEITQKETFSLTGLVVIDPRLPCISGSKMHLDEAVDDKGGSLLGETTEFIKAPPPLDSRNFLQYYVGLKSRPDMGTVIRRAKGAVSTLLAVKSEVWEINDVRNAAGASKTLHTNLGELTYSLNSVEKAENQLFFGFSVTGPALAALPGLRPPTLDSIAAYNADGKLLPGSSGSSLTQGPDRLECSFGVSLTDPAQVPAKFVLTLPLDIRRLDMPFEIKNIPLPPTEPTDSAITAVKPQPPDEAPALTVEEALQRVKGPRLITLHFKDAGADEVVAEMSRQSGIPVSFNKEQPTLIPTISIDIDKQPFWTALRSVIGACKLRYTCQPHNRSITLYEDTSGARAVGQWQGPLGASGLTRIRAIQSQRALEAQVSMASPPGSLRHSINLSCEFALDPQLKSLPYSSEIRLEEALDDKGNALSLVPESAIAYGAMSNCSDLRFERNIILQPRGYSQRLAHLQGVIRVDAALSTEIFEIPDVLGAEDSIHKVHMTWGGKTYDQTYTLDNFVVNDEEVQFTVHIANNLEAVTQNGMRLQSIPQFLQSHVQLRDKNGQLFPIINLIMPTQKLDVVVVHIPLRLYAYTMAAPDKLSVEVPSEIQTVAIPFEFKNLLLP